MCLFPQKPPNLFKRHHLALPSESLLTPSDLSVEHPWTILPLEHCISAAALPWVPHPLEQSHRRPPDDDRDQSPTGPPMELLLRMPWQQEHPMWNSPGTSCTPSAWARGETARLQVLLHCDWESQKLVWSNILLKYSLTTDVSLLVQIGKCETRPISGMVMVVKYLQSSFTKQERDLNTELATVQLSRTGHSMAQPSSKLK